MTLLCAIVLSGCSPNPQTTLSPQSDVANSIQNLFILTVVAGLIVVVPVEIVLILTVLRFRRRKGEAPGPPVGRHGSTRLEIGWTFIPVLIMAVIAVPTVQVIFATAAPAPADSIQVVIVGHQWWWEIKYPKLNIVTANELHLPVNQKANFLLESADVIHSFWLPRFDGKRDVIPNHVNNIWFTPNNIGVFPGQCAEFCGPGHAEMQLSAVVESKAAFDAWVRDEQQPRPAVPRSASAEVRRGAVVFQQSACAGCHTIAGTPAQGKIGPNLTHVGSRQNIGWQEGLTNTPANLELWIKDSSQYKPGSYMPPQNLSKTDLAAVAAYLTSLK